MNILITNNHSALNLGDEAILHVTLDGIRRAYPGAHITLAANDPHSWMKFQPVEVVSSFYNWICDDRRNQKPQFGKLLQTWIGLAWAESYYTSTGKPFFFGNPDQQRLLRAYYAADLVLSCGGGNFYSNKKSGVLFALRSHLKMIDFAAGLGKPIIMLPQSIGPLPGQFAKAICRKVFNRTHRILVRDRPSQELLQQIGVNRPIVLLPDLAFALPDSSSPSSTIPGLQAGAIPRVGVTLIDYQAINHGFKLQKTYEEAILAAVVHLQQTTGAQIFFFVQCYGPASNQDDRGITRRFYDRLGSNNGNVFLMDSFQNAMDLQAAFRQMDLVIGTRMHSTILALNGGVPVVLVGYQPKSAGMMEFFGLGDYCCPINELQIDAFCSLVSRAMRNRSSLRAQVIESLKSVHQQLEGWEKYLAL